MKIKIIFFVHNLFTEDAVESRRVDSSSGTDSGENELGSSTSASDLSSDDSVVDPDYKIASHPSGSTSDSSSEETTPQRKGCENVKLSSSISEKTPSRSVVRPSENKQRGRKRLRNPDLWQKNQAKRARNAGESYTSSSSTHKAVAARVLQPPCNEKCRMKCYSKFTEDQRKKIFDAYWDLKDLQRQREFLLASMLEVKPKYQYPKGNSNRHPNSAFYFDVEGRKSRVCKHFFKSTLCINDRPIRTVLEKRNVTTGNIISLDMRGKHGHHSKVDENIKQSVRDHISSIPCIPSHYCRAVTDKKYIEGSKTIADLHRDYVQLCEDKNQHSANYVMYSRIFREEFNLSFFVPKKDQCEQCLAYSNASEKEKAELQHSHETHLKETKLSREEKMNDKSNTDTTVVAVFDLQAVLPCPNGQASSFYYVSKLNVFNFTVYNLKTNEADCYVWHEGEAQRGVNEIASLILLYLENTKTEDSHEIDVVFYSDNCAGQQKNRFMIAAYMYAVMKYEWIRSLTHKFLITGHSQNEGDSTHSVIERHITRALKSGPIYVPEQYVSLIRCAKKTGKPYKVHEISHEDIKDLKALSVDLGLQITKNTDGEQFKISEVKVLKVEKNHLGKLFYKTSYENEDFKEVNVFLSRRGNKINRVSNIKHASLKNAYPRKVGISEKKKDGLLSLFRKKCIPNCYATFYSNL